MFSKMATFAKFLPLLPHLTSVKIPTNILPAAVVPVVVESMSLSPDAANRLKGLATALGEGGRSEISLYELVVSPGFADLVSAFTTSKAKERPIPCVICPCCKSTFALGSPPENPETE